MATIACVSQRTLGHVIPAVSLGKKLRDAGHTVYLFGHESNRALAEGQGLSFEKVGWDKYPEMYIEYFLRDILQACVRHAVDLIVCDSAQSAPAFAAEILGLRWVSFQPSVPMPESLIPGSRSVNDKLRMVYFNHLNEIRSNYGLRPMEDFARSRGDYAGLSPYLHLVMVYPQLLSGDEELPSSACIVGPCGLPADVGREPDEHPASFVICTSSISKLEHRSVVGAYIKVGLDYALKNAVDTVVCADDNYRCPTYLPEHVRWIVQHPSHNRFLPSAEAAMIHGGFGTLQNCLQFGIPTVIIPLTEDQRIIAERCVKLGVSVTVTPEGALWSNLESILEAVRSDPAMRARSSALVASLRERDPLEFAANRIELLMM